MQVRKKSLAILFIAVICVAAITSYQHNLASEQKCHEEVSRIALALDSYFLDQGGHFPEGLKDLVPSYLETDFLNSANVQYTRISDREYLLKSSLRGHDACWASELGLSWVLSKKA